MSYLEQSIKQARLGVNSRLNPEGQPKLNEEGFKKPVSPEFFTNKLAQLKNVLNVINIEELREGRLVLAENSTIKVKIEKAPEIGTILAEIPNPHKDLLDKLARANRIFRGIRGCRCKGEDKSPHCKSRACKNKGKQPKQIDITAGGRPERNSKQTAAKSETPRPRSEQKKSA